MSIPVDAFVVVAWVLLAGMALTVIALKAPRFGVRLSVYLTGAMSWLVVMLFVFSNNPTTESLDRAPTDGYDSAEPFNGLPSGEFAKVDIGAGGGCGIRADRSVVCWSTRTRLPTSRVVEHPGEYHAVAAGHRHACGLTTGGAVRCWGSSNKYGQSAPPDGEFVTVDTGNDHTCGLRADRTVECWGRNYDQQSTPPRGKFSQLAVGGHHACAIRPDGTVECWGWNGDGQRDAPDGPFTVLTAGRHHTCGIRPGNEGACWGLNNHGQATPPGGPVTSVKATALGTCWAAPAGQVTCQGRIVEPLKRWTENNVHYWKTPPRRTSEDTKETP